MKECARDSSRDRSQQLQYWLLAASARRIWPTNRNVLHHDLELILLVKGGLVEGVGSSRQRLDQTATHLEELDHLVRSSVIVAAVVFENRARGVGFAAVLESTWSTCG